MKRITSLLILGLALVFSCTKNGPEGVNKIDGLYTAPAGATVMSAVSSATSTWSVDRRYFDLSFGSTLSTTLVGYDALLASGQYLLGADEIGKAINTKVNGSAPGDGYITVNKNGSDYQITATLDGKVYYWTGTLPFVADPDPVELSEVLQAQSNVANGTNSVTMQLATPGISKSYNESWQEVWTGEGGYLALDLYSEDGYLHDGIYKASAQGGVIEPDQFGIGWDPGDIYGIGWEFTDWGTCWWTVKDGAATATKITGGMVAVSSREEKVDDKDVTIWTISWGKDFPVEKVFEGAIPVLTKPKKPSGPVQLDYVYTIGEPQPCSTASGEVVAGVMKYPITVTNASGQEAAYLEFVLAEGSTDLAEGDYVSTEYASAVGQLANGYYLDFSDYGWGIIAGGSYYINGAGEKVYLDPGVTVTVTQVATGAFRFTSTDFDLAAAGPNYVPDQGGEGDDDVTGDVVLKITSGLTYTMEDQTSGSTSADGSALSGVTLWRVNILQSGELVANFDLVVKAGSSDLAGSYTVMSYPDAVGKAGNGWGFAAWNMFGGCYFKVDGAYFFIPNDATVTVSANSDGSLKFKFEGPIQDENYAEAGTGGVLLNNVTKG